jgi:hypothetical protein
MDTSAILALFARLGTWLQCQFTRQSCSVLASLLLRRRLRRDIRNCGRIRAWEPSYNVAIGDLEPPDTLPSDMRQDS